MTDLNSFAQRNVETDRVGQGTMMEQSRAVAEVFAAAQLASQYPRDEQAAEVGVRRACGIVSFAEAAQYALPQAGQIITGPSVDLARELARLWGHISHGVVELRRDDRYQQSEMLAYAWDVASNTRAARTFIVPHFRDKKGGPAALTTLSAITNQNNAVASRQQREVIFAVLPKWLTVLAERLCEQTLHDDIIENGGRAEQFVKQFEDLGVKQRAIETFLGKADAPKARNKWTSTDITRLGVIGRSLSRNEVTIEDVFPGSRSNRAPSTAEVQRPPARPLQPDARAAQLPLSEQVRAEHKAADEAELNAVFEREQEERAAQERIAELDAQAGPDRGLDDPEAGE